MKEREHHKKAFELYYRDGRHRSLSRVAAKMDVSLNTVKTWSSEFDWRARLEERDQEVGRVLADQSIRAAVDSKRRNQTLVQLALATIARQLAEQKVRVTISDLDRVLRLEAFLEGQADSRQEIVARDLQGKSNEELRELLKREIAELDDLVGDGPPN